MGVLRARVGSQWIDVGGSTGDPVWVDPNPPTDPNVDIWYDTDAYGTAGTANPAIPLGVIGRPVLISVDQTGITSAGADLTGFSATMAVVAGRLYEVTWNLTTVQNTSAANQIIYGSIDGTTHILHNNNPVAAGTTTTLTGSMTFSGGAQLGSLPFCAAGAAKIIKLRGYTGTGTMSIVSGNACNGRFWIKDIGAAV
jgi:hypothetical protein